MESNEENINIKKYNIFLILIKIAIFVGIFLVAFSYYIYINSFNDICCKESSQDYYNYYADIEHCLGSSKEIENLNSKLEVYEGNQNKKTIKKLVNYIVEVAKTYYDEQGMVLRVNFIEEDNIITAELTKPCGEEEGLTDYLEVLSNIKKKLDLYTIFDVSFERYSDNLIYEISIDTANIENVNNN